MKKLILTTILFLFIFCEIVLANTKGVLEFINVTTPFQDPERFIYPGRMFLTRSGEPPDYGVTDGFDGEPPDFQVDYSVFEYYYPALIIYSQIPDYDLLYDERPADNNDDIYILKLFCLETGVQENRLIVNFYVDDANERFDGKTIIFESDRLRYGYAIDVRAVIEKGYRENNGYPPIFLINTPCECSDGFYIYDTATLTIGTKTLAETITGESANLVSLAILAVDWQKPRGKYHSDISGPDGIPDGHVNYYDLAALAEGWLNGS